jgi:hypothetical protein
MIKEAAAALTADLGQFLDREWEDKSLNEILKAPVSALQGVSEGDAEALRAAFNVKTVGTWVGTSSFTRLRPLPCSARREPSSNLSTGPSHKETIMIEWTRAGP